MTNDSAIPFGPSAKPDGNDADIHTERPPISETARRALEEAARRREAAEEAARTSPVEVGGRKGPDPTRFGDWEKNGIASDF